MSYETMFEIVAAELKLKEPVAIFSSTDRQIRTLRAMANLEGRLLARRHSWQALVRTASFTTLGAEFQGLLADLAPGFAYMLPRAMWNTSLTQPVQGGLTEQDRAVILGSGMSGPYSRFQVRAQGLYMLPAPTAGQTVTFPYMSSYFCASSAGVEQTEWAALDDVGLLDETVMMLGWKWRWLRTNRFDYAQEHEEYEIEVNNAIARDGSPKVIRAIGGGEAYTPPPPLIPDGSWNL